MPTALAVFYGASLLLTTIAAMYAWDEVGVWLALIIIALGGILIGLLLRSYFRMRGRAIRRDRLGS